MRRHWCALLGRGRGGCLRPHVAAMSLMLGFCGHAEDESHRVDRIHARYDEAGAMGTRAVAVPDLAFAKMVAELSPRKWIVTMQVIVCPRSDFCCFLATSRALRRRDAAGKPSADCSPLPG